jgi:hypothetical protein
MSRDAARSSHSKFVTCGGRPWICRARLVPVPWSTRPWALPFLTLLAPSAAVAESQRTVIDWTLVMVRLVARWLKHRPRPGWPPLPIRWVLMVEPTGRLAPQAFFTTDLTLPPACVVERFG